MKKIAALLGILLLVAVTLSPVMAANFYWKTSLAGLNAVSGKADGDRGIVIDVAGAVTFYYHIGGAWTAGTVHAAALSANGTNCAAGEASLGVDAAGNSEGCWTPTAGGATTLTLPWDNVTSRPTINSVTVTGAVLDNASNYPTLNQSTTGNAASADTASALSGQYIDWTASTGGTSIANQPTFNGSVLAGAALDNILNYPVPVLGTNTTGDYVSDVTAGGFLIKTGTAGATLGLDNTCALNEIPKWNGSAWVCAVDASGGAGGNPSFDNVQSGTNTSAAMVLGTGSSLAASGSGTITATALSAQYIDWAQSSGATSVANRPAINSIAVTGAVLDNVSNYPAGLLRTTGSAASLTSVTASNVAFGSDARGDIAVRGASAYGRLAKGSSGAVLTGNGTDPSWSAFTLAAPGATGAVLTSDGTNWTRNSAPAISAANLTSFPTTLARSPSAGDTRAIVVIDNSGNMTRTGCTVATDNSISCPQTAVGGQMTLLEAAGNGSEYRALRAPTSLSDNVVFLLPSTAPTDNQVLQCNAPVAGVSTCSFVAQSGGGGSSVTPAGSDGQIQYRLNGTTLGAIPGAGFNAADNSLTLPGIIRMSAEDNTAGFNVSHAGVIPGTAYHGDTYFDNVANKYVWFQASDNTWVSLANANATQTFGFGWDNAALSDNNVVFPEVPRAMTITKIRCMASADNVVGYLSECAPTDKTSCVRVDNTNWTFTNAVSAVSYYSGFENPGIAASASLLWTTVSVGSANNKFTCSVQYNE